MSNQQIGGCTTLRLHSVGGQRAQVLSVTADHKVPRKTASLFACAGVAVGALGNGDQLGCSIGAPESCRRSPGSSCVPGCECHCAPSAVRAYAGQSLRAASPPRRCGGNGADRHAAQCASSADSRYSALSTPSSSSRRRIEIGSGRSRSQVLDGITSGACYSNALA